MAKFELHDRRDGVTNPIIKKLVEPFTEFEVIKGKIDLLGKSKYLTDGQGIILYTIVLKNLSTFDLDLDEQLNKDLNDAIVWFMSKLGQNSNYFNQSKKRQNDEF